MGATVWQQGEWQVSVPLRRMLSSPTSHTWTHSQLKRICGPAETQVSWGILSFTWHLCHLRDGPGRRVGRGSGQRLREGRTLVGGRVAKPGASA